MAIVIKEMQVRTVVEKKIVAETEIPEEVYRKIQDRVLEKLSVSPAKYPEPRRKKER